MRTKVLLCVLAAAGLVAAKKNDEQVSFKRQIQPIFDRQCSYCHNSIDPYAGLALDAKYSRTQLVDVPSTEKADMARVKPGSPDQSYLIRKLENTHVEAGGSGFRMPLGPSPTTQFAPADIAMIRKWVQEGAPDN